MQTYQVISAMVIPICHSSLSVVVDEYCVVKKRNTLHLQYLYSVKINKCVQPVESLWEETQLNLKEQSQKLNNKVSYFLSAARAVREKEYIFFTNE